MSTENKKGKLLNNISSAMDNLNKTLDKVGITAEKIQSATEKVSDVTKQVTKTATEAGKAVYQKAKEVDYAELAKKTTDKASAVVQSTKNVATNASKKGEELILEYFDSNGDGKVDIEDIIIVSLKMPGVRINRDDFLQKELFKKYDQDTIDQAIATYPMKAGIKEEDIDKIADEVINYERNCVSGISAVLGTAGGLAMAATLPADIAQYYGYMLRAAQKLLYLYGFPQIVATKDGNYFDSETINILTLCLGVMYGAAGANNALKAIAKALASGVEKKLVNAALTKGTIYPIVKSVASWFGKKMTKQVFAGFFKNVIPVVGAAVGGGITYLSFKPCCVKLQNSLKNTRLSNPNYDETKEDDDSIIIDAEIAEE